MKEKYLIQIDVEYAIPFYDLDPLGIVWHGNYYKYFEKSREKLLNTIGFGYSVMNQSQFIFPIVESHAKYISPLLFEQEVIITAGLVEYENRIKIGYLIRDKATGKKQAEGHTIQVAVRKDNKELVFVSPTALIEGVKKCLKK